MFFGRNEECGLRCVDQGWKFDNDDNRVDMPSEPAHSYSYKVRSAAVVLTGDIPFHEGAQEELKSMP